MDFYVTVSSGPTSDFSSNNSTWSEYNLEKPIELVGQYEVALVQSVFKDVFTSSLASVNILPSDFGMQIYRFEMYANDGDDAETIIKNLNERMMSSFNSSDAPFFEFDNEKLEFKVVLPNGWNHFITDIDSYNLSHILENSYKFKNKKFYHPRHFYVYSNLIDDQITGNTRHPLLTNFCLPDVKSNVVQYCANNFRYVPVKDNFIKNFFLEYSSSIYTGIQLSGEIISTLHFRKVNGF